MTIPSGKIREKYIKRFEETIAGLNTAQKEAVSTLEGPVLAIAGPGTGKTHILAARIGQILQQTDADPHNILCLTFTDSGVLAMRNRLTAFMGPEAHRVHIYTFHSFCNKVIQENLDYFGRYNLEPLSDLERIETIRNLLDELPYHHPLKKSADPYQHERKLDDLFKQMKKESWSVDLIKQRAKTYLEDLPNREEFIYKRKAGDFKKGDLKVHKIDAEKQRMKLLVAGAELFENFTRLMHQQQRYDFEDMILWVLKAFENNKNLLLTYQEQYLYFLVDEFQDTNGAQNQVLQYLIDFWDTPNVFVVGDDDQSIYEFQGARVKNIIDFYEKYKSGLKLVLLKDNYRSSQHILDTARLLINNNQLRIIKRLESLQLDKNLRAQNTIFANSDLHPQIVEFENKAQEETDLVNKLVALRDKGVELNEIAVIFAKHRQVRTLIQLLEKNAVPYTTKRKINLLELPLVIQIQKILEYLQLEFNEPYSGESILFEILHFDFLGIAPIDLAKMSRYMALRANSGIYTYWRDLLHNEGLQKELTLTKSLSIKKFASLIEDWLSVLNSINLTKLVERIVNRSGLLEKVLNGEEKAMSVQVLNTLFDFIETESDKHPYLKVSELLETFRRMEANKLSLPLMKAVYASDGVQLVTAHSSKGLEFRYVFMLGCIKDYWEPSSRLSNYQFSFPDNLTFSNAEDAMEASRRLFYVAMTRAKEVLQISYPRTKMTGKPYQRSQFVDELLVDDSLGISKVNLEESMVVDAQELLLKEDLKPRVNGLDSASLDALLEGFALSISSMNTFLRCPLTFYYEFVLKVPHSESNAASYGTAMHLALQRYFNKMLDSLDNSFPEMGVLIDLFKKSLFLQKGKLTKKVYQELQIQGEAHFKSYFEQRFPNWTKSIATERPFKNVVFKGIPLSGAIDKVEFINDNEVHLVDYKTGQLSDERMRKPSTRKPEGGAYWRQLVFYKILFEAAGNTRRKVRSAAIDYLTPDVDDVFPIKKLVMEEGQVEILSKMITETYARIQTHDFFEGCGEKSCKWCNFVRQHIPSDSFVSEDIELLDDIN